MTKKKKSRKKLNQDTYSLIKSHIVDIINSSEEQLSLKQIIKRLGIRDKKSKNAAREIFQNLKVSDSGRVVATSGREVITGVVDYVNPRFAYIISEEVEQDVVVKTDNLLNAFDEDLVKIKLMPKRHKNARREGKVVEVLERKRNQFVGRIERNDRFAFVVPDFRKMYHDIFVPLAKLKGAEQDDKVIVEIQQWPTNDKSPEGKVLKVLGPSGQNEAEIHSIIAEFGLPYDFEKEVMQAAEQTKPGFTKAEIAKRRDFREVTTFTIDPEDAKDFDDAISIQHLENGNVELGVHIADVTHYLRPGTELDEEAIKRGTSVYLVDRTIPMLPERLSNDLCSLRPKVDRFTFSAVFEVDANARIINEWFGKTIIHSDRRFSYEEAQERIEKVEGEYARELTVLNELALKLRANRFANGSVNFETNEIKFNLDEQGHPVGVYQKIRKDAHKMIEEFMLLANRRVATRIHEMKKGKEELTFVYRTHDYPDQEKLKGFSAFAGRFGHKINLDETAVASSINKLMEEIEGRPEEHVLSNLAIRAMAKALYTTEDTGHFGLAFDHYTHFTSPIRRYPDVMVHRLLFSYLNGQKSEPRAVFDKLCKHSSEMEKRAADAERASIKYKQVEFMQDKLGEEFEGIVSGVTEWGIYVEMTEAKCEGMVRLADMDDDYYVFDNENYRIIGERTSRVITLGNRLKVRVVKTDINRRTIDLDLVDYIE